MPNVNLNPHQGPVIPVVPPAQGAAPGAPAPLPEEPISEESSVIKIEKRIKALNNDWKLEMIDDVKASFKKDPDGSIVMDTYLATGKDEQGKEIQALHISFEMKWQVTLNNGTLVELNDRIYTNVKVPSSSDNIFALSKAKHQAMQAAATYQEVIGAALNPNDPLHQQYVGQLSLLRADGTLHLHEDPGVLASYTKIDAGERIPFKISKSANFQIGTQNETTFRVDYLARHTISASSEIFRMPEVGPNPQKTVASSIRISAANARLMICENPLIPQTVADKDHLEHLSLNSSLNEQLQQHPGTDGQKFVQALYEGVLRDLDAFRTKVKEVDETGIFPVNVNAIPKNKKPLLSSIKEIAKESLHFPQTLYKKARRAFRKQNDLLGCVRRQCEKIQEQIDAFVGEEDKLTQLRQAQTQLEQQLLIYTDEEEQLKEIITSMEYKVRLIEKYVQDEVADGERGSYEPYITQLNQLTQICKSAIAVQPVV